MLVTAMGLLETFFNRGLAGPTVLSETGFTAAATTADPFTLPIVVACRRLISDTCSSFPMVSVDDSGTEVRNQPILLERPDPLQTRGDFIERTVNDMTRHGAAWWLVTGRSDRNHPLGLRIVDPNQVTPVLDRSGSYMTGAELNSKFYPPEDLVQCPFILDDSPVGRAPIREIREATENLRAALLFSSTYYGSGAIPPYVLTSSTRLPKLQAEELMTAWLEARDKSRPALLTGDLDLKAVKGQTAADALVLDALRYFDATIAAVMQVPPSLVNVESHASLTYSTSRGESQKFLVGLNSSFLKRLESSFTEMLPRGQNAKFDTSSLVELDSTESLANAVTAYEAGLIDRDEARATLGKELLP